MEPVTHVLTGACLARAGLNRKAAYTTVAMAVAAELPDIDTVWSVRGPVESFTHHRGITHTFVGFPVEAAVVVGVVWAVHRWRVSRGKGATAAPVRWGLLYGFVLLALLSHLFLDWTNNYGVRPLYPFDKHWFAGSFVFIFDPYLFLVLLGAAVAPWLFRLVSREIGGKKEAFVSRGWAWAALVVMVGMWGTRAALHQRAVTVAMGQSYEMEQTAVAIGDAVLVGLPPVVLEAKRTLVSPDPLSLFRWYSATDFGPVYQLATVDAYTGLSESTQYAVPKMQLSATWLAAERSGIGRAYLDWSSMPLVRIDHDETDPSGEKVVTFQDGRFMGDSLVLSMAGRSPLTATVTLDRNNRVVEETMDGKIQK